ncbi:MAG: hypothetical protein ACOCXM_04890 [Myxococcota bacterium]
MTSRSATVRRPAPGADRPRGWTVALAATGGLAAGLWLVAATLTAPRDEPAAPRGQPTAEPAASGTSPSPAAAPQGNDGGPDADPAAAHDPPTRATDAAEAPEEGPEEGPAREAPTEESAAAPPAEGRPSSGAGPADRPATDRPTGGSIHRVRVAYLRCEGLPLEEGPYPCPRDRALEEAAWSAIDTLPECPGAPPPAGQADVRLHFGAQDPPEVRLRSRATDLEQAPLLDCLREPLGALTTIHEPEDMVVSFRFRFEPR